MNYLATIVYELKIMLDRFGGSCTMGTKLNDIYGVYEDED